MPPTRPGSTLSGLALPLLLITLPVAAPLHAHGGQGEQGHSHATEQTAAGKHDHTAEQSAAGTHDHAAGQSAAGTHDHAAGSAHEPAQLHKGTALIGARELYIENCGSCHGERGHGTEAAAVDFADAEALVRLTREAISAMLDDRHGGRLAAPVPAGERDEIIGYLRNYLMLPAPDADTDIGRAIYARSCSVCHGDRGDAASWAKNSLNPSPADFTAHGLEKLSREKMIDSVTFGSRNTAMMPFTVQLSREEIVATVDYIRAAFMPEGMGQGGEGHDHVDEIQKAAEAGGDDAPFPVGLIGDPAWGRQFYAANCAECHGKKGDGDGPRAYFMIKKPENFLSPAARAELNRPELFENVSEGVVGTTMPAWEKVLTEQEIANVSEYVYRAFLHPDRFAAIELPAEVVAPGWERAEPAPESAKKN
ncbi:MAG TPA: c-type cytochrome [Thermohalobaculum sp.]|nr:c-type cytochrome [Thermohalobaculum sp.]